LTSRKAGFPHTPAKKRRFEKDDVMKDLAEAFAIVGAIAVLFFFIPLIGVLAGAFCGLVVGFVFDETFFRFQQAIGMADVAPWQIGAAFGFIGGFFKTTFQKGSDK
jgi:hypothetical protein